MMNYLCTRGGSCYAASAAILKGIAENGGLYMPSELPVIPRAQIEALADFSYAERAAYTMSLLLNDFNQSELLRICSDAYTSFDCAAIAPVASIEENTYALELFHGPTLAFKDMALQVLPYLMSSSARKQQESRIIDILTATSGDTGKAALAGFRDVPGTSITVFYPQGGVSLMQERQMVTSEGCNTHVIAVQGNFDDAQNGVKRLFTDVSFIQKLSAHGHMLSSANSINLGRLVPQVAYYLSACSDLLRRGAISWEQGVDVCVPTGNFGDILAGWYARRMGAPIRRLICASNANRVLTDFISTGVYNNVNRSLVKTISPSMDILISSNLERYLLELADYRAETVVSWMRALRSEGSFSLGAEQLNRMQSVFSCGFADDSETRLEIARLYRASGYVMDPHTAVASAVLHRLRTQGKCDRPALIISTASPYKFAIDVLIALGLKTKSAFTALEDLEKISGIRIPASVAHLLDLPVLHTAVCKKDCMQQALEDALKI